MNEAQQQHQQDHEQQPMQQQQQDQEYTQEQMAYDMCAPARAPSPAFSDFYYSGSGGASLAEHYAEYGNPVFILGPRGPPSRSGGGARG